jgi:hypothetical protein
LGFVSSAKLKFRLSEDNESIHDVVLVRLEVLSVEVEEKDAVDSLLVICSYFVDIFGDLESDAADTEDEDGGSA